MLFVLLLLNTVYYTLVIIIIPSVWFFLLVESIQLKFIKLKPNYSIRRSNLNAHSSLRINHTNGLQQPCVCVCLEDIFGESLSPLYPCAQVYFTGIFSFYIFFVHIREREGKTLIQCIGYWTWQYGI